MICVVDASVAMQPRSRVGSGAELLTAALDLRTSTRYSFYASLVIAAALHAGGE